MAINKEYIIKSLQLWLCIFIIIDSQYLVNGDSDWIQKCGVCHCKWNSGKKTADCKNMSMLEIPTDMSSEMQVMDLSYNQIAELRRNEFSDASLENLHKIFMKNCTLQEINRDALQGLHVLIELDFSNNHLKELHPGTFNGLIKLRTVLLNNNDLEVLEDSLFKNLTFLYKLELKDNRLHRIGSNTFVNTFNVVQIFFDSNNLTILRKETFATLHKLKSLSLSANPWNCTCDLQHFQQFVIDKNLYTPPTSCFEPKSLRGKLWTDIPNEMFACAPRILDPKGGNTIVDAISSNVTLRCNIKATPAPTIEWLFNKRTLILDSRIFVNFTFETNKITNESLYKGSMSIVGVRNSDKGTYTCVATNKGGKDEADILLAIPAQTVARGAIGGDGSQGTAVTNSSNLLIIICLIAIILLAILIIIVLVLCCYCRRIKQYSKNGSISENGLVSSKMDKSQQGDSILEGSVIMEMQKSLLTEVNPVEKPPRRTELDSTGELIEDGHELKKTLLDETNFGKFL